MSKEDFAEEIQSIWITGGTFAMKREKSIKILEKYEQHADTAWRNSYERRIRDFFKDLKTHLNKLF